MHPYLGGIGLLFAIDFIIFFLFLIPLMFYTLELVFTSSSSVKTSIMLHTIMFYILSFSIGYIITRFLLG